MDGESENVEFYVYFNTDEYVSLENAGLPDDIAPGETRKYTLDLVHEFDILKVLTITFTDGTIIKFNEYDFRFLSEE